MESFFGSLKTELVHRTRFRTRAEAKHTLFRWIESYYNRRRRHSALGYLTPAQAFDQMKGGCLMHSSGVSAQAKEGHWSNSSPGCTTTFNKNWRRFAKASGILEPRAMPASKFGLTFFKLTCHGGIKQLPPMLLIAMDFSVGRSMSLFLIANILRLFFSIKARQSSRPKASTLFLRQSR